MLRAQRRRGRAVDGLPAPAGAGRGRRRRRHPHSRTARRPTASAATPRPGAITTTGLPPLRAHRRDRGPGRGALGRRGRPTTPATPRRRPHGRAVRCLRGLRPAGASPRPRRAGDSYAESGDRSREVPSASGPCSAAQRTIIWLTTVGATARRNPIRCGSCGRRRRRCSSTTARRHRLAHVAAAARVALNLDGDGQGREHRRPGRVARPTTPSRCAQHPELRREVRVDDGPGGGTLPEFGARTPWRCGLRCGAYRGLTMIDVGRRRFEEMVTRPSTAAAELARPCATWRCRRGHVGDAAAARPLRRHPAHRAAVGLLGVATRPASRSTGCRSARLRHRGRRDTAKCGSPSSTRSGTTSASVTIGCTTSAGSGLHPQPSLFRRFPPS